MSLENELSKLKSAFPHLLALKTEVSEKNVAWHIDHSLKVMIMICKTLQKSNPENYEPKFNLMWLLVSTLGRIPRGKGKAPRYVLPPEKIEETSLHIQFEEAQKLLTEVEKLPAKSFMKHPIFGVLPRQGAIKFMKIHTNHHLKIIQDITK